MMTELAHMWAAIGESYLSVSDVEVRDVLINKHYILWLRIHMTRRDAHASPLLLVTSE